MQIIAALFGFAQNEQLAALDLAFVATLRLFSF